MMWILSRIGIYKTFYESKWSLRNIYWLSVLLLMAELLANTAAAQNASPCLLTNFKQAPVFAVAANPGFMGAEDLDGDGKTDILTVNNGVSVSVLRNLGGGNFAPKIDFPVIAGAYSVALADVDGDGKKDIVLTLSGNPVISVLRNTSSGAGNINFSSAVSFPAAPSASIAVTDLNSDGKLDVVISNNTANSVMVLVNNSPGAGTVSFAAVVSYTVGSQPFGVAVGDLDGDGKPEIVTGNNLQTVSVLRNTSTSTVSFAPKADFQGGPFNNSRPGSVVITDLTADGKPEIALANMMAETITVLRNTSSGTGSISLAAPVNFDTGYAPNFMVGSDFDGDGKVDLATSNYNGNTVSVLRNNGSGGTVSFESRREFGVGRLAASLASSDFDGDGRIDLAVTNSKTGGVSFLKNKSIAAGFIQFNARPEFGIGAFGKNPFSIAASDFDNDGKKDLLTANNSNSISILRNVGTNAGIVKFSQNIDFPAAGGASPYWGEARDLDGDGKNDVVIANSNLSSISVFRNTSAGLGSINFAARIDFAVGGGPRFVTTGDFDNDGKFDVAVVNYSSNSVSILRNTGSGPGTISLAAPIVLTVNSNPTFLAVTDLDGDGKADIVVANNSSTNISVFRNSSSAAGIIAFDPKTDVTVNSNPYSVAAGDFDGDGKKDLAVTNRLSNNGIVSVLRNTSTGPANIGFDPPVDFTILPEELSAALGQIVAGDIDGNGKDDLIFTNMQFSFVSILRNNTSGPGTISFAPRTDEVASAVVMSIVVDDFDRDNKKEIVFASYNSSNVGLLQNPCSVIHFNAFDFDGDLKTDISIFRPSVGEWWYSRSSDGQVPAAGFGTGTDRPVPADFSGDGKTDIAFWRPTTGEWFVLRSENGSYFSFPFGTTGDVPIPADYDGDGMADVAVYRPSTNEWFIRKSTGGVRILTFGATGDVPVIADYDGDGQADVAIYRPSVGEWWIVNSSNGIVYAFQFGNSSDKPLPGDYTGDGRADAAFFRPSNGNWYILRSEDSSYFSFPFGAAADLPVAGDYDGDGLFDAAVFRPSTSTWYINQTTAGVRIDSFGAAGDRPLPNVFVP
ncbi:MAG: VCBS repeat-containing protein [Acidobacteria bacterium]|nr:VCBS repeat-containing protein [Acidobacteriota bacterium]